jgi:hypothetical protein
MAHATDTRGVPKLIQHAAREQANHQRTAQFLRIQNASERVQIMTRDQRTAAWDNSRQLTITVIDDVKHVEFVPMSTEPPRIVHESIDKSFERASGPHSSKQRKTSGQANKRGTHFRDAKVVREVNAQTLVQNVSDQVHAAPLVFREVAKNSNANSTHGGPALTKQIAAGGVTRGQM